MEQKIHNEVNIHSDWVMPECWPENKTLGFVRSKKGNVLFHVLNDYAYPIMVNELVFRIDYLNKIIEELRERSKNGE